MEPGARRKAPVLFQHDNYEFSEFVRVPGKAYLVENGHSLFKRYNDAQGHGQAHPKGAPMLPRSCVAAFIKGTTINRTLRLAAKQHESAESVVIMLKEY